MKRKKDKRSSEVAKSMRATKLQLVHTDIVDPIEVKSLKSHRYFITFIDDFSRKIWVYFLKENLEELEKFKEFKAMVKIQSGSQIKVLFVRQRRRVYLKSI